MIPSSSKELREKIEKQLYMEAIEKRYGLSKVEGEAEIQILRTQISTLRARLYSLEATYKDKLECFQYNCGRQGHDLVAEKDDDYHNTRTYYVCSRCDFFTRYK